MSTRRLAAVMSALLVAIMLTTPSTAAPGIEAGVMQSPGSATGQPDAENNTMYIFGKAGLTPCWSKFNNTDGDSDAYGEDSKGGNQAMNVKVTCRMDPALQGNVRLAVGEMINMRFTLNLGGTWENGQGSCNGDCENLNVSLIKGNREVAVKEFSSLSDDVNTIMWDLPVTEDLVPWNGSQENFAIEFRMIIKSTAGTWFSADDEAIFGIWFAHPDNNPGDYPMVTFPILNESAVEELEGTGGGGGGDTPGFTTMIGIGGLAAAALLRPKSEDEE
jgi:hypothetical protein